MCGWVFVWGVMGSPYPKRSIFLGFPVALVGTTRWDFPCTERGGACRWGGRCSRYTHGVAWNVFLTSRSRESIIQNVSDATLNFSRGSYWFSGRASYKYKRGATQAPGRASYNNAAYASGRASHNDTTHAPGGLEEACVLWKIHWYYIFLVC